ncbi:hypothetical protein BFO_2115 [Tannerella forsythia 92A2]|uniref:Uncharacterized protein n=1 Tax=Tannerella forsythia (strain ATCC 43037 / JCM 10827 / CCUG 21028 A / KCTC 5666 / FDC 338) TaxID=203275 RepID=G8UHY8_TANFA|nr:hypothetical protein [Tannerella forsythia]AEW20226.1 hypothetical protein BFO_2115 [Tannerella forsythia 92A2]
MLKNNFDYRTDKQKYLFSFVSQKGTDRSEKPPENGYRSKTSRKGNRHTTDSP